MRITRASLVVAVAICGLACLSPLWPCAAQNQRPPTVAVLPSDAELDALLAARNWNGLGAALSQPVPLESFQRGMNWLHTRLDAGGGLMLGILYARDLWVLGNRLNVEDPAKDMRMTAGMITLYTYELIVIDGTKCEDRTAPANRISQLFKARAATLAFLKKQSAAWKQSTVDIAVAFEKKTAPLRREDDLICRDGLDQMKAGIERGSQHEVTTPSNHFGKTVEVSPPADWAPRFVPPSVHEPMQSKARSEMRVDLLKIIE